MRGKIPWQTPSAGLYTISEWEIEGRATALIIVDLQVGHVDPEQGAGPTLRADFPALAEYYYARVQGTVLPTVLELQAFLREHHLPVIYALSGLTLPDGRELAPWSWRAAQIRQTDARIPLLLPPGAPAREPWQPLAPRPDELLFYKPTLSPFNGTPLDQCLRNMRIETVVVVGVLTNAAADTTARDAGDRGYNAILVEDGCAALSAEDHEAGTAFPNWYAVKSKGEVFDQLGPLVSIDT